MTNLNKIGLLFQIDKDRSLEFQVQRALDSWNRNKMLRDYVPEFIVFNINNDIKENKILELEVQYSKYVQHNCFQIEGSTD